MRCTQCDNDFDACDLGLYNEINKEGTIIDSLYLCEICVKFLSEYDAENPDEPHIEFVESMADKKIRITQIGFYCPRCGETHFWDISIKDEPFKDYLPPQSAGFMRADCGAKYSLDIQIAKMVQFIHITRDKK